MERVCNAPEHIFSLVYTIEHFKADEALEASAALKRRALCCHRLVLLLITIIIIDRHRRFSICRVRLQNDGIPINLAHGLCAMSSRRQSQPSLAFADSRLSAELFVSIWCRCSQREKAVRLTSQ